MGVKNGYGSSGFVRQPGVPPTEADGEEGDDGLDPLAEDIEGAVDRADGPTTVADEQATAARASRGRSMALGPTPPGCTG